MLISILTITYNRVNAIRRLWDSLNRIEDRDFEWIVIDNGSKDNTSEIVSVWKRIADFNIISKRLPFNQGKAKGLNVGKTLISGEFVVVVDDDDSLFDNAIILIQLYIKKININQRQDIGGLCFRAIDEYGELSGFRSPVDLVTESTSLEMQFVHKRLISAEQCCVRKSSVFKKYQHIELPPPNNSLLSTVDHRISRKYKTIYINVPIKVVYRHDGLNRMTQRPRFYSRMSIGGYLEFLYRLNEQVDYFWHCPSFFSRSAKNMFCSGLHNRKRPSEQLKELTNRRARILWTIFGIIPGIVKFMTDMLRLRIGNIVYAESKGYKGY